MKKGGGITSAPREGWPLAPRRRGVNLTLAFGAPEGRAAVLSKAFHGATATSRAAWLALAIVDLKRVLEITEFARSLAVITQRRAACFNGCVQHRANRGNKPHGMIGRRAAFRCERGRLTLWRQMRAKQRLADIDIAKPRDNALVEQRGLQRCLLARASLRQHGRERARNVLDAEPSTASILEKIAIAHSAAFRESLRGMTNPYGDGHAAERIVRVLTTVPLEGILRKRARAQTEEAALP